MYCAITFTDLVMLEYEQNSRDLDFILIPKQRVNRKRIAMVWLILNHRTFRN